MHFDCLILGSGPAGLYSALGCAKKGYSTAIVENRAWGGTGFRDGCLPVKKALDRLRILERYNDLFADNRGHDPDILYAFLHDNEEKMKQVEAIILKRLANAGVKTLFGDGSFVSDHVYRVSGKEIAADNIVIATGTSPASPVGISLDNDRIITHREALQLTDPPEKMIIIGGNVEGMEFASLFSGLGTKVTVMEQDGEILTGNDRDLIAPLLKVLTEKGVVFKTGTKAVSVSAAEKAVSVITSDGDRISADNVLVTGFRSPNVPDGLDNTGVIHTEVSIPVDNCLQTNIPGIFAVGDINGIHGMAHIALQQGLFIPEAIEGKEVPRIYEALPRAMFTIPEIAGAGKQEWELENEGVQYKSVSVELGDTWRGFSKDLESGFIKLLFDKNELLTGIWMTGDGASEIMASAGLFLGGRVSKNDILNNLFIHPSLGEGMLEAALKL